MNGIKYHRIMRGYSRPELARKAGMGIATVTAFEKAACPSGGRTFHYIALREALGVSINDLLRQDYPDDIFEAQSQAMGKSRTEYPSNCISIYRHVHGLTFQSLAHRFGNATRESGRQACAREEPCKEHIEALAKYEGVSTTTFLKKYAPESEGKSV